MFTALKLRVLNMATNDPQTLALGVFAFIACAVPAILSLIF